jgi:DNA primase
MVLPQGFIQDLISRVDIVDVVGRHVELKKAGINHKGLCPFHGEKTPSFIVSPSRQTYHCFGCGAHGDAIRFLTEHGGLGFMDAVRELAQSVGMQVPEDDRSPLDRARDAEQRERQASLTDVLARAGAHWRKQLKGSERAIDYLKRRGLTGEIAARFGLGYAPEGWRGLASAFPSYDDPLLVDAGLVILKSDEGADAGDGKRYDRFRDRIMFPIRSVKAEVIGFGGRVLDQGEPKYLNSPETPVFSKGRELYGLYEARQAMRERGYVLVVEGYMDVVALAQSGLGNAVATLGTACTAEHVAKLFRFTDAVVFSFDGDAAGRRAAGRALEAALPHASDLRSIRFLFLPPEHDPDSFVRDLGREAFEAEVARALTLSAMLLQTAQEGADLATPEGRARMLAQARLLVEPMPPSLLREQVVAELARLGGTDPQSLQQAWMATAPRRPRPAGDGSAFAPPAGRSGPAGRPRAARGRALPRATATLLDRAAWLLLQQSALWERLGPDDHERLAGLPAPYGGFFAWVERTLHDHGALSRSGLLQQLQADTEATLESDAGEAQAGVAALAGRLAELVDLEHDVDAEAALREALRRLQADEVNDEIALILESGPPSGAALERYRELETLRRSLKAGG